MHTQNSALQDIVEGHQVYTLIGLTIASVLGGPITGSILLYKNYLTFTNINNARNTILFATIGSILFLHQMGLH